MKKVLVLALTMLLIAPVTLVGQSKGENEAFNTAKLHLANRRVSDAQPILEKLVASDPENANLNYLLGLCYVQQDINQDEAVRLLEKASKRYTKDYDAGSATERNAPEYVYYYLLIAYSQAGNCSQSLATLNKFYSIYSYEDEYYLVDGQKWVRECNIRKKEEEEKQRQQQEEPPALAAAEPAPLQATTPDPEPTAQPAEEKEAQPEPANEPEPEAAPVTAQEAAPQVEEESRKPRMELKERLVRYQANDAVSTKNIEYTTASSLYGVQVGAFLEPKFVRSFKGLKNIEVYIDQYGVFRYVIGRFTFRSQAEALLAKVREAGYQDAFIVDVNNTRKYTEEVVTVGQESIKWQIRGKVDFRVQVGAFREIIPERIVDKYLEIEGLQENTQKELTILTVGSFGNYEEASSFRNQLKEKGIEDAFVVAFNYDRKIPVDEAKSYVNTGSEAAPASKKGRKKGKKQREEQEETSGL